MGFFYLLFTNYRPSVLSSFLNLECMHMKEGLIFDGVLGHQKAKRLLDLAITNPQHGYVITGPDGVGVHPLAECLVRRLADEYKGESLMTHPDILILERELSDRGTGLKKEISVAAVRELKLRVSQSPSIASRLVIYIPDADYLNEEGVNALLKCIEEPTVQAVYVLAAHAVGRLPSTLLSRIREIRLDRVDQNEIQNWLVQKGIESSMANKAAMNSDGRPGYAMRYVEDAEARMQIEQINTEIQQLVQAKSSGALLAAIAKTASACDSAEDPVTEWRKALQLWQASLRRMPHVDPKRQHLIGRALIAAERSIGSSIPPRVWLELALVNGFRKQGTLSSSFLPHAIPFLPEQFENS